MAGYTLYGRPNTASGAVEAALRELGVAYTLITVEIRSGAHLAPDFTAINPRQQLPALVLPDETVVTELAAILLHLADAHPAARLAPAPGSSARATHDRWLTFMAVNLYEGALRQAYPARYTDDPKGAAAVESAANRYVERHYALIEEAISAQPFFFGAQLTMADIYLWQMALWADRKWLASHCPKVMALVTQVASRPAIAPVHEAHFGA